MNSRKTFFIGLILLFIITGCNSKQVQKTPEFRIQTGHDLTLFTTTDTHYLSKKLTDGGPAFQKFLAAGDGKQLGYSDEMISAFANDIQIQHPDVAIISGDLTNNGEKQSHQDLAKQLKAIESSTGTRVYVIPGNHDLLNPWARKFKGEHQYTTESIGAKEFRDIYSSFGYDEALSQDKDSLSYLAAPSDDLWLLMLDTNQYLNNSELGYPQLDGRLTASTLKWIDECGTLAAKSGAQIVAVMHHSLLDHSKLIQEGFTINNNEKVIDTLLRNGITTAFSGHIHIQDISSYQQNSKQIYDIANSALSVFPHQFGILKYSATNRTMDYTTAPLNMELWAKANGSTDPNLLHFNTYSEQSFGDLSYNRTYKRLTENIAYNNYTDHELQAMADTVRRLNENYFAGTANTDNAAVLSSDGYRLWMDAPSDGLKSYVLRMTEREAKDNHHLHVQLP